MALPAILAVPVVWEAITAGLAWIARKKLWAVVTLGPAAAAYDSASDGELTKLMEYVRKAAAGALNYYLGTEFTESDLASEHAFKVAMGREVSGKSGILLRDITDRRTTEEDLENHALMMIEQKTSVKLSSLRNVDLLKRDFARIAGSHISERVGVPLSNILDVETTKAEILDWAQDEVMIRIGDSVTAAVQARMAGGVSMLQMIKDRIGKDVRPALLLRSVNDAMVGRYVVRWEVFNELSKADKRKIQLKIAQRRFRDKANPNSELYDGRTGGRMAYVPKGWSAHVDPPNVPVSKIKRAGRTVGAALARLREKVGPAPTEAQTP